MPMFFKLIRESFLFAVKSVMVNRLRTFLSLFGISIGIFSIISVFTVLDWMEKSIRDSISSLGENVIYIHKYPWGLDPNMKWWDIIRRPQVSERDFEAVSKKTTRAEAIALQASQTVKLEYHNNVANRIAILAVSTGYDEVRTFEIENGRYFSPFEESSGNNVVVLGDELAKKLFENISPVGKVISISEYKATVIGVFKKEGKGGLSDSGLDNVAVIPLNFGRNFINMHSNFIDMTIAMKGKPEVPVQELSDEAKMILRAARRLQPGVEDDFSINRASLISQGFDAVFAGINIGGWVIGGFSILVGGFGIANIMFVSVRERTNIIGIQKALGAKKAFILQQFLFESILLSITGGLIGLILIYTGTICINYLYELNMHLTVGNFSLAIFISGLIGVIAGYAPAYAAARMDPVKAIGYSF
jgi:putative ABC transport system permease protein